MPPRDFGFKPPPFLISIETGEKGRCYVFEPGDSPGFSIDVKFPVPDCGPPGMTIGGAELDPYDLQRAIDFVKSNEFAFVDAYHEAKGVGLPLEVDDLGDVNFDDLRKNGRSE